MNIDIERFKSAFWIALKLTSFLFYLICGCFLGIYLCTVSIFLGFGVIFIWACGLFTIAFYFDVG